MALPVEDIMCDQCIISSEINITVEHNENYNVSVPATKLWLQNIIYSLTNQLVPALAAFLANSIATSLAPLQRLPLCLPSGVIRIRLRRTTKSQLAITDEIKTKNLEACVKEKVDNMSETAENMSEKCVDCVVLHEPEGEAYADIIFVHGLHGGLDRTWAQGQWRQKNPKLQNLTPVRRHSTGDIMYVPIKEESTPHQGKLKRTIKRIYTIPVILARKQTNNNNTEEKVEQNNDKELQITRVEEDEIDNVNNNSDDEDFTRCWPQDWLPQDCPGMRVLGINYTTDKLWRPLWQKMKTRTDLIQRSKEMEQELLSLGVGKRPIVWVGHSKGGLFIKQMVLNAKNADVEDNLKNLFAQTRSIMFYSVPHKGSPIANMIFPFFRRSIEVLEVQTNCEFVLNLHRRFLEIFNEENDNKPEIFSFIDTENTPVGFTSLKFIAYESADPDIGTKCDVPLDHREICKPAGRDCFLYLELVKLINRSIFNQHNRTEP